MTSLTDTAVLDFDDADRHVSLGQALRREGQHEQAIRAFRAALSIQPTHLGAARALVTTLEGRGELEDAAAAWVTYAQALFEAGLLPDASLAFREALRRNPKSLKALYGLGRLGFARADYADAIRWFKAALAVNPAHTRSHISLGWAYQLTGNLEEGWPEISWEVPAQVVSNRDFEQPVWDGHSDRRQRILCWAEHGLGDAIHVLRYLPLLAHRGHFVIVECQRRLVPLVERMPGVHCVIPQGAPLPSFDVHAPLLLIPGLLGAGADVPRGPYLHADATLTERWRSRLSPDGNLTVGLSWGGKTTSATASRRFVALSAFAPLAATPRVRFVSLQHGPQAAELSSPPAGLTVEVVQDETCSLDDAAALIVNLDLVVTVDTMVAHLAGALGKKVWTLLPFRADWRWQLDPHQTIWYPTMRLFRQEEEGDWEGTVRRVQAALALERPLR
jgi:hypothetical protein